MLLLDQDEGRSGDSCTSWGPVAAAWSQVPLPLLQLRVAGWQEGARPGLPCAWTVPQSLWALSALGHHLHREPECVSSEQLPLLGGVTGLCHFWVRFLVQRSTPSLQGHESVRVFCKWLWERKRVMLKILGGAGAADSE